MRVAVVGLPYFTERLTRELCDAVPGFSFRAYNTYYSKWHQVLFALNLPFTDIVLSLNGVSDQSGSLDLAVLFRKKICFQWQGTDVMLAVERSRNGSILRKYIDQASHIAVAPWLRDELREIGIEAPFVDFKWVDVPENLPPYKNHGVYTYLAEGREDFYGWQEIKKLAIAFPQIEFQVAGSRGPGLDVPKNVRFLGWLQAPQMKELRENTPIYLRLPEHDGYSNAVLEALSVGNEVIWNRPGMHCHCVSPETLSGTFSQVYDNLKTRGFVRNQEYIDYMKTHYNREQVLKTLVQQMQKVIG